MTGKDWLAWHGDYDRPGSRLHERLRAVQRHIRSTLDEAPAGPVRVVSVCAGQGRDLLEVLRDHPRRGDVTARLVELDERNVGIARAAVAELGVDDRVTVLQGDAAATDVYVGAVPANLVLACGIFGNVTDADIERTVTELPGFCAPRATVIWTRGGDEDRIERVDRWFRAAGFERLAIERGTEAPPFGVGVHRLVGAPRPLPAGLTLFAFRADRRSAPAASPAPVEPA